MNKDVWKILEEPHAHAILLYICDNPKSLKSDIYAALKESSRQTIQKRIDTFIDHHLIAVTNSMTHKAGRYLTLTEEGKEIAILAMDMKIILDRL